MKDAVKDLRDAMGRAKGLRRGLTQGELGDKVGRSAQTIQKYEKGVEVPEHIVRQLIGLAADIARADLVKRMEAHLKERVGQKVEPEPNMYAMVSELTEALESIVLELAAMRHDLASNTAATAELKQRLEQSSEQ